jgi:cytochrome c-type biogenesis protein CcmH
MSMARVDELKAQLRQVEELARSGVLTESQAGEARQRLERELLDAVMRAEPAAAAASSARTQARPAVDDAAPASAVHPPRKLVLASTLFVLLFGLAGYAWLGNFAGLEVAPGQAGAPAEGGPAGGHTADSAQIEAMTQKLADRLKDKPDDAEGWSMLGRSYSVLNRFGDAVPVFRKVIELRPADAQAHADLADALGMVNGKSLEGEPAKLIEKALKLDGNNLKALSLAGTIAYLRNDFAGAVSYWERGVKAGDPTSEMVRNLQAGIEEARQRGGLAAPKSSPSAASSASATQASPAAPTTAAAAGAEVAGRVTLAAAIRDKAAPTDTVFVFARPAEGPRMPLAILRKQVKDLPLDFTLDDSMAMSPSAKLSGAPMVVVGARISKSGNAMAQPGDLQGLSGPIKPGTKGLAIEINEAVK